MHHFKFIGGRYAKSILAIMPLCKINSANIPGLYFLKNVMFLFLLFVLHSSALYNEISGMLLSLEL